MDVEHVRAGDRNGEDPGGGTVGVSLVVDDVVEYDVGGAAELLVPCAADVEGYMGCRLTWNVNGILLYGMRVR